MEFTTIRIHNLIQIYEDARLIQIYARGNKQREGRTEGDAHGEVGGGLLRGRWRVAQPRAVGPERLGHGDLRELLLQRVRDDLVVLDRVDPDLGGSRGGCGHLVAVENGACALGLWRRLPWRPTAKGRIGREGKVRRRGWTRARKEGKGLPGQRR